MKHFNKIYKFAPTKSTIEVELASARICQSALFCFPKSAQKICKVQLSFFSKVTRVHVFQHDNIWSYRHFRSQLSCFTMPHFSLGTDLAMVKSNVIGKAFTQSVQYCLFKTELYGFQSSYWKTTKYYTRLFENLIHVRTGRNHKIIFPSNNDFLIHKSIKWTFTNMHASFQTSKKYIS